MAIHHRNKLPAVSYCYDNRCTIFRPFVNLPPPPPPPPPLLPQIPRFVETNRSNQNHTLMLILVPSFCLLSFVLLVLVYLVLLKKYNSIFAISFWRRNRPAFDNDHVELAHPSHGSVGLQQSIIDSIAVFEYKSDDGLIEGSECSICLNEFQ